MPKLELILNPESTVDPRESEHIRREVRGFLLCSVTLAVSTGGFAADSGGGGRFPPGPSGRPAAAASAKPD